MTRPTPTPVSFAGTWNLSSVDGSPLPYVYQGSDPKYELLGRQFIATAAGTLTESGTVRRTTTAGVVTVSPFGFPGTWEAKGDTVTLRFPYAAAAFITGAVSANTLTAKENGDARVYIYTRQ